MTRAAATLAPQTAAQMREQRPARVQAVEDADRRKEETALAYTEGRASLADLEAAEEDHRAAQRDLDRHDATTKALEDREAQEKRQAEEKAKQVQAAELHALVEMLSRQWSEVTEATSTASVAWQRLIETAKAAAFIAQHPSANACIQAVFPQMQAAILGRFGGLLPGARHSIERGDLGARLAADLRAEFIRAGIPMPPLPTEETSDA